jgi:hypothetical protein
VKSYAGALGFEATSTAWWRSGSISASSNRYSRDGSKAVDELLYAQLWCAEGRTISAP